MAGIASGDREDEDGVVEDTVGSCDPRLTAGLTAGLTAERIRPGEGSRIGQDGTGVGPHVPVRPGADLHCPACQRAPDVPSSAGLRRPTRPPRPTRRLPPSCPASAAHLDRGGRSRGRADPMQVAARWCHRVPGCSVDRRWPTCVPTTRRSSRSTSTSGCLSPMGNLRRGCSSPGVVRSSRPTTDWWLSAPVSCASVGCRHRAPCGG